jgi:hypothetical protein
VKTDEPMWTHHSCQSQILHYHSLFVLYILRVWTNLYWQISATAVSNRDVLLCLCSVITYNSDDWRCLWIYKRIKSKVCEIVAPWKCCLEMFEGEILIWLI